MRLIDGDQLEQRLLDEAARIMAEDLYGKDRQRLARGLQKAAEICRAAMTMNDIERLLECLTCEREPLACGCTEKDEREDGSCVKYKGGDDDEID